MARIGTQLVINSTSQEIVIDSSVVAFVAVNDHNSNTAKIKVSIQPSNETKASVSNTHLVWKVAVAPNSTEKFELNNGRIYIDVLEKIYAVSDNDVTFYLIVE